MAIALSTRRARRASSTSTIWRPSSGALDVPPQAAADWTVLEPPALARDIVSTHHRYLHEELPIVDTLAERVLTVHEDRHQKLAEVRRLVAALRADLEPHMAKEERVLFPAIDAVAPVSGTSRSAPLRTPFG